MNGFWNAIIIIRAVAIEYSWFECVYISRLQIRLMFCAYLFIFKLKKYIPSPQMYV